MTIISTPQAFNEDELYVDLEPTFGRSLFVRGREKVPTGGQLAVPVGGQ